MVKKYLEFLNEGRVPPSERIKLIDDKNYLLVVPLTDRASCKYGAFSNWCTAVPHSGASIEENDTNKGVDKLVYLLNRNYNKDTSIADEYAWKHSEHEAGELDFMEVYDFRMEHDFEIFNLEKIAFEYVMGRYRIWDKNNIEMTEFGYGLDDLDLDEYVIDALKNYCQGNG